MSGGQMPVCLNPAFMFAGVMALFQAMLNTGKNSAFVIALPPTVRLNLYLLFHCHLHILHFPQV